MRRADWVATLLDLGRRHGEIPIYGSSEWEALPTSDPRKFASCVRAAEAWRMDGTDEEVAKKFLDELEQNDLLVRYRAAAASRDVAAAMNVRRRARG